MRPLPFLWPYWPVFWVVFLWAYWPEFGIVRRAREPAAKSESPDAGSFRLIVLGMSVATFAAFPLAWLRVLRASDSRQLVLFVLGVGTLLGGSLLRRHCWHLLSASFTGDVRARPDQAIIQTGAYSLVRHPSYTAGILMNLGIGLALGSWGSVALLTVASIAVYVYRMNVEERTLLEVVGEPYREYMRNRPRRLFPFIY